MKFKHTVAFLEALRDELGDDLVYSLSLDHDDVLVTISTHKSNRLYRHGRQMQSCKIALSEFKKENRQLAEEIAGHYLPLLVVEGEQLRKSMDYALAGS